MLNGFFIPNHKGAIFFSIFFLLYLFHFHTIYLCETILLYGKKNIPSMMMMMMMRESMSINIFTHLLHWTNTMEYINVKYKRFYDMLLDDSPSLLLHYNIYVVAIYKRVWVCVCMCRSYFVFHFIKWLCWTYSTLFMVSTMKKVTVATNERHKKWLCTQKTK